MTKNKDIPELVFQLSREVTPQGKVILDELLRRLVFELESISQTIDLERKGHDRSL